MEKETQPSISELTKIINAPLPFRNAKKKEFRFKKELATLINRYSKENDSNTPDFILAEYINDCLKSFARAVKMRDEWYDFKPASKCNTIQNVAPNIKMDEFFIKD